MESVNCEKMHVTVGPYSYMGIIDSGQSEKELKRDGDTG